ncbi:hypothetical protein PTKIN_Ptkin14bG0202000 [Pterospermum kingtungense]
MSKPEEQLPLFGLTMALVLVLLLTGFVAKAEAKDCDRSSSCGNLTISYPFRLKGQPTCNRTDLWVELECDSDNRTIWVRKTGIFSVREIFYSNSTIRLVDASLQDGDNCSLPRSSFSFNDGLPCYAPWFSRSDSLSSLMYVENCTRPVKSSVYVDASRCTTNSSSYFYFLDEKTPPHDFSEFCTTIAEDVPVMMENITGIPSTLDIYQNLLMGFDLSWEYVSFYCSETSKFRTIFAAVMYALRNYADSFVYYLTNGSHVSFNTNNPPKGILNNEHIIFVLKLQVTFTFAIV